MMRHRDIHSAKLPKFIEYYLQPNDPERFTMFTPNGWMIYKARTEEGSLFGRGRRSTLLKYVPDKDGNVITQKIASVNWRNWEFQPLCVLEPATISDPSRLTGDVRLQDILYGKKQTSITRYFRLGDKEYRWKFSRRTADFTLANMAEPDISLAIYRQHVRAKGAFKGEHRSVLIIKPSCDINVDDVVFSFMIMEKKRRDKHGNEYPRKRFPDGADAAEGDEGGGYDGGFGGDGGGGGAGGGMG